VNVVYNEREIKRAFREKELGLGQRVQKEKPENPNTKKKQKR